MQYFTFGHLADDPSIQLYIKNYGKQKSLFLVEFFNDLYDRRERLHAFVS